MNFKTILPTAMAVFGGLTISHAQDNNAAVIDTLETTCTCAFKKPLVVSSVYQADNQTSVLRYNTIKKDLVFIADAKKSEISDKLGYVEKDENTKIRYSEKQNNIPADFKEVVDLMLEFAKESCAVKKNEAEIFPSTETNKALRAVFKTHRP